MHTKEPKGIFSNEIWFFQILFVVALVAALAIYFRSKEANKESPPLPSERVEVR